MEILVAIPEVNPERAGKRAREVVTTCANLGRNWESGRAMGEEGGRAGGRNWERAGAIGGEGGRVTGRRVGCRMVVALGVLEWPEPVGERRGFPKVGLVLVFKSTLVGTVGSSEKPCA